MRRVIAFMLILLATPTAFSQKTDAIAFSHDVQPIFARRCLQCHGSSAQEGGLRLDNRDGALAELESEERAIVPGNLNASVLLARVTSDDPDLRMPPEGKPLTEDEVATLRSWIQEGAEWQGHWAFEPPVAQQPPVVKNKAWVRSPIDAFILSRLEAKGLTPAAPADKIALLRRACYDLIGLPPTPDQVAAFLSDTSPQAFEKVIDHLLESPQYGEKWARHWLDLVRYAETNGYERDSRKDLIWKYRDYVIRAFNEDKPYDRFIQEQLAGDELPDKDSDSITATGIYRLGIWDDEPADRPLARYDYLDDIVRTTGETLLGMTIGCGRCHDHKIDPIAQKDYYSMLSFFSDISPHGGGKANHVPVSSFADQAVFEKKRADKKRLEKELTEKIFQIETSFLTELKVKHPELKVDTAKPVGPANGVVLADSRKAGQEWEYTLQKPADNWFEIAFDDSKWKKGPGGFGTRGTPGSVVRTEWRTREIWLRKDFGLTDIPAKLTLNIHHDEDAEVYLNGKRIASFKGYIGDYKQLDVTMQAADLLQTGRNTVAVHCRQTGGGQYIDVGLIGDFSVTTAASLARKYGKEILGPERLAEWRQMQRTLAQSQSQKLELKTEYVMAVAERGRNKTWILGRGNPSMQGEEVGPAFPQVLNPPAAEIPTEYNTGATTGKRRRLAEWIASRDNPMTARVIVNRLWQHHFGRGIVRSASDFGYQGTPPTHPALLDWLAVDFRRGGWKMKAMHKRMMLSSTYQMASTHNAEAYAKDPVNDLFWRFDIRRLTAEEIRDSILAVTGTLNPKMFGPSIFPPLPQEVLATASRPGAAWGRSSPEEAARRTIYIHVKRSLRPPMLANFDVPDTDTPCAVRMSTTVPTQSLGMLNSKFLNEQAANFATRLREECGDSRQAQVTAAIRLTTGRTPTAKEVEGDIAFMDELMQDEKLSPDDALRHYALLMLNTNEFIYLD